MIKAGVICEVEIRAYHAMLEKILRLRDSTLADLIVALAFLFFCSTTRSELRGIDNMARHRIRRLEFL